MADTDLHHSNEYRTRCYAHRAGRRRGLSSFLHAVGQIMAQNTKKKKAFTTVVRTTL